MSNSSKGWSEPARDEHANDAGFHRNDLAEFRFAALEVFACGKHIIEEDDLMLQWL